MKRKKLTNKEIEKIQKLLIELVIAEYRKNIPNREEEIKKLIDRLSDQKKFT